MSKHYYLFRHGETFFSQTDTPYGEHEHTAHILEEKKYAIKNIAEYLQDKKIEYATRSEFLRCQETAEIIEKHTSLRFEPDPLLNEFTENQFEDFKRRMEDTVAKLESLPSRTIAICTHGAVVAALRKMIIGEDFHSKDLMFYPKTGVILVVSGGSVKEVDCN